jgi:23S rRNA (pseudouridine1915-N3)-methyltransferase
VKLHIVWIGKTKQPAIQSLTAEYLERLNGFTQVDALSLASEAALLRNLEKKAPRAPSLVLLDIAGRQLTSEELAKFIDDHQNRSPQPLLFAIGPADGFSEQARSKASLVLSLSKMTLPHELARVVMLEQLYRAYSILKGHPYHLGH